MAFYDLSKEKRAELVDNIHAAILSDISKGKDAAIRKYASDEDTYIRKTVYLSIGKIHKANEALRPKILKLLGNLLKNDNEKVRQTVVNAAGEIGMYDFDVVEHIMETGLFDSHH